MVALCVLGTWLLAWAALKGKLGQGPRSAALDVVHGAAGYTRPLWDAEGWAREEAGWDRIRLLGEAAGCRAHGWAPLPPAPAAAGGDALAGAGAGVAAPTGSGSGSARTRRVVDVFLFQDEFALLRLRMLQLASRGQADTAFGVLPGEGNRSSPVTMVAVEADTTFTLAPKRLLLAEAVRAALEAGVGPLAGWVDRSTVRLSSAGGAWGAPPDGAGSAADWLGAELIGSDAEWARSGWEAPPAPPAPAWEEWDPSAGAGAPPRSTKALLAELGMPLLVVVRSTANRQLKGFAAEGLQRSAMRAAGERAAGALGGTLMLAGDIDEVPRRSALGLLRACAVEGLAEAERRGLVSPPGWEGHAADEPADSAPSGCAESDAAAGPRAPDGQGGGASLPPAGTPAQRTERPATSMAVGGDRRPESCDRSSLGIPALVGQREPLPAVGVVHLEMQSFLYSLQHPRGVVKHAAVTVWSAAAESPLSWWGHSRRSDILLGAAGWHCSWCFRRVAQAVNKALTYSHSDRAHRPDHTDPAAMQRRMCSGADPFDQVPEVYTLAALADATISSASEARDATDVPVLVARQPWAVPWLLPGRCEREDAPPGWRGDSRASTGTGGSAAD